MNMYLCFIYGIAIGNIGYPHKPSYSYWTFIETLQVIAVISWSAFLGFLAGKEHQKEQQ